MVGKLPLRLGLPAHRLVPGIWCGHPTLDWLVVDADRHGGPDGVSAFDALVRRARERASGWATHDDRPSRRLIDWSLRQSRWQSTGRLCCRKVPMVMASERADVASVGFQREVANKPHAAPAFARRRPPKGPGLKCSPGPICESNPTARPARSRRRQRSRGPAGPEASTATN